jgi:hypothetical protein
MSSGLTYVLLTDASSASPDLATSPVVFYDYAEAQKFADWWIRILYARSYPEAEVGVWTSSPNQNGYWTAPGGVATFNSFD